MTAVTSVRNGIRRFYAQFTLPCDMAVRFCLSMLVFFSIREMTGFAPFWSGNVFLVFLSLGLSLLPSFSIALAAFVMMMAQSLPVGLDMAAAAMALIAMLYLLFVRFVAEDLVFFVLMIPAMYLGCAPFLLILTAMKKRLSILAALLPGTLLYSFLEILGRRADALSALKGDYASRLQLVLGDLFSGEIVVYMIAMAGIVSIVGAMRVMRFAYARELSCVTGAIVYIGFLLLGNLIPGIRIHIEFAALSAAVSCLAALLPVFLMDPAVYRRSENLMFEDEGYVYYVRAVPKPDGSGNPGEAGRFRPLSGRTEEER